MKMILAASIIVLAQYGVPPMRVERDAASPPSRPGFIYQPPIYVEPLPWNRGIPYAPQYQVVQPGSGNLPTYIVPEPDGSVGIIPQGKSK